MFLALRPPEWKLSPDVHGENFHCKPAGLDFSSSAKINEFIIRGTEMNTR